MSTKKYLYAAVGAQVAVAKSAQAKIEDLVARLNENATSASTDLKKRVDVWAGEGEQFLGKVTDTKALDDLTSKVDFDQVQTQVHKLRDQLEDIVGTWRSNFRPESKPAEKVAVEDTPATAPKKPAAKTTAAKAPAAKTTAAKKPAARKPAAKKPAAKSTAAAKPAAQQAS
jgi:hypothetical protein